MAAAVVVNLIEGERVLGEVEVYSIDDQNGVVWDRDEIRISEYSQSSERCPPLAVLHTVTSSSSDSGGLCFKLELKDKSQQNSPLSILHATCLRENKTAIMPLDEEDELHLVAMHSRQHEGQFPCFWGFIVASRLYNSCLVMLNLRCLGIVFDLDETLIVANTMRSFEDRIEALQRKINSEVDQQRVSAMLAEIKRYQDDKNILKQYAENDQVVDNGKVVKSQPEVVLALSDNHQTIVRPLLRLQEKNIILTRINPQIRDTSVLVRLRPAWEDLRNYLTARGRKRFEVYVCTMAERDYALEMWRLLDPDSNLIDPKELLDRIVCVKSGLRKSLFNVFQHGNCHPKMALVIDDRLKVWDEKDQPRVHVVPAFAPYYAPQAEANNAIPVLCVARNVACNVRGGFFKEFDEGLLQRISEVAYEDDIKEIPSPPDVSNYLISEDDPSASNGNKDSLGFDGMADVEVERRLKEAISASSTAPLAIPNLDPKIVATVQYAVPSSISVLQPTMSGPVVPFPSQQLSQVTSVLKNPINQTILPPEASLQSSPAREEGEVPESELDPDTRRRLLILQHGQDSRERTSSEPQFPVRTPLQVSAPRAQGRGWFPIDEEMSPRQLNRVVPPKDFPLRSEPMEIEKHRSSHSPFLQKAESAVPPDRAFLENQRMLKETLPREDHLRLNQPVASFPSFSGEEASMVRSSSANRDLDLESGQIDPQAETPIGALHDIAFKCGTKVEFKQALVSSSELQFCAEVWFGGEKIGEGIGRTRREAQRQAADGSLMNLADKYISSLKPDSSSVPGEWRRFPNTSNNGFANDFSSWGYQQLPKEEPGSFSTASMPPRVLDSRLEASKRPVGPIAALKELCSMEGLGLAFQTQPQLSANPGQKNEVYAQVEIDGQVLGKGIGINWDEAKSQAAEKALGTLKSMLGSYGHKRQGSPRPWQGMSSKRLKPEFSRVLQRMPSSARYPKNASPVP
ncbi:RNA polymerase II C-terminal domain phosphatase-like 1 [Coffea eugenioides]|uniref:RNA polymerase II C-terminal domain phosphatase-like 1 n=1 Tax=Coffea eugenioides TaxID=49369 RepID=UPI000F6130E1|nr:RNA polymerase II C-terminal domain phosphatase-like 1 [Coffea eugenioides]